MGMLQTAGWAMLGGVFLGALHFYGLRENRNFLPMRAGSSECGGFARHGVAQL